MSSGKQPSRNLQVIRNDHNKGWNRSLATAWDEPWHSLSTEARRVYLIDLVPPAKGIELNPPGVFLESLPEAAVKKLVAAGFARIERGTGKRAPMVVALPSTYHFSLRLRSIHRFRLLGPRNLLLLQTFVRSTFLSMGSLVVSSVLRAVGMSNLVRHDEGLDDYVTSGQWPDWALKAIGTRDSAAVLDAIRKADRPVKLADLPRLVKGLKPKEIAETLSDLVAHLAVFEDVDPDTLEIVVGLLPSVRSNQELLKSASQPVKPLVCEKPREIGPLGGLAINDLRVFLLEVAGDAPRLKQDGMLFAKEESRFLAALPPLPGWIESMLKLSPERRLLQAFVQSRSLRFTEAEHEDRASWLKLSERAKKWLALGLEEQYVRFFQAYRDPGQISKIPDYDNEDDDYYDDGLNSYLGNDAQDLYYGVSVAVHKVTPKSPKYISYYTPMTEQVRKALNDSIYKAFETLPLGVFHRWDSVLAYLCSEKVNPLNLGGDPLSVAVFVNQRQVPRLREPMINSARLFLEAFMMSRLLPFDAFRPAIDAEGNLCVARHPRFAGYFGRPYDPGQDEVSTSTKVIVQPDFSVLVIGLDPAPAVELAPFCERSAGHAGQGALTFKITRESVVRAAMQGLNARAILARLKKFASVEIPSNVTSEITEWAGWVRLVNVRPVMVIRCPDSQTVARVVSALGKKAERLGETLAALHTHRLTPAERAKLQEQGILVTKEDIDFHSRDHPASTATPSPSSPRKRGRPRKSR